MYVWRLTYDESGKAYTAQRLSGLDNVMRYAGCSVRTIGNAGIRVVTEVPKHAREAMMGEGLEGCRLLEYGTAVQWDDVLEGSGDSLTLDTTKMSSYAYNLAEGQRPDLQRDGNGREVHGCSRQLSR